jgi:hypothetical protein
VDLPEVLEGPDAEAKVSVDGAELRASLSESLGWECEGVRVCMTHIGGCPGSYDRRAEKVVRDPALGLLHMNPGACGHNGWHIMRTLLRFTVAAGKISDAQAIELGPRGRRTML